MKKNLLLLMFLSHAFAPQIRLTGFAGSEFYTDKFLYDPYAVDVQHLIEKCGTDKNCMSKLISKLKEMCGSKLIKFAWGDKVLNIKTQSALFAGLQEVTLTVAKITFFIEEILPTDDRYADYYRPYETYCRRNCITPSDDVSLFVSSSDLSLFLSGFDRNAVGEISLDNRKFLNTRLIFAKLFESLHYFKFDDATVRNFANTIIEEKRLC